MAPPACLLSFDPPELHFADVQLGQVYTQHISVRNNLSIGVAFSIRPGSSDRYSVSPPSLTLPAGGCAAVVVSLKVTKWADRRKGETAGHRDIFHVKSSYFEQKFYATFILAPLGPPAYAPSQYEGLLSPSRGGRHATAVPSSGGAGANCHRREGLAVPHSSGHADKWASPPQPRRQPSPTPCVQEGLGGPQHHAEGAHGMRSPRAGPRQGGPEEARGPSSVLTPGVRDPRHVPALRGLASPPLPQPLSSPRSSSPVRAAAPATERAPRPAGGSVEEVATAELLREKDGIIAALKAQLQVRSGRAVLLEGAHHPDRGSSAGVLVERVAEVEGANEALRARLREVTLELQASSAERTTLRQLQERLEATTPDARVLAEAALVRERAQAATREEKVLAVLAAKDAALAVLEEDMAAAGATLEGMRAAVEGVCGELERSEARVVELLEGRHAAREQAAAERQQAQRRLQEARDARDEAERRAQEAESSHTQVQAQLEQVEARVAELVAANQELTAQLSQAKQASTHTDRSTECIKELEAVVASGHDAPAAWRQALAEAEEALSAKDAVVQQLEETLSRQMARIEALTTQLVTAPHSSAGVHEAVLQARVAELEQQLAARSAALSLDLSEPPPEPRQAWPLGPSEPPTGQEPAASRPAGRTYIHVLSKGGTRKSPQRPTARLGDSVQGAGREGAAAAVLTRAEAAEQTARDLEARVAALQGRLEAERQQAGVQGRSRAEAQEALAQRALHTLEVDRLRIQVTDLEREVAAASAGVAQRERRWLEQKEGAVRRGLAAAGTHAAEVGAATRRAAEAERQAALRSVEAGQAREEAAAAKEEAQRARAAVSASKMAADRRVAAKEEEVRQLKEEARSLRRAAEQAASVAEEKGLQVGVLMETVDTLHAGSPTEREQRLVSLTAQLAGAKAVHAVLDRRATHLQEEARQAVAARSRVEEEVGRLQAALQQREQRLAVSGSAVEAGQQHVAQLRAELRSREAEAAGLARELQACKEALQAKTEEAASREAAAEQQRKRLQAQIQRERNEAAAQLQAVRTEHEAVQDGAACPPPVPACLQQLLDEVRAKGEGDWRAAVVARLSSLVLDSTRQLSRAQAEGRVQREDALRLRGLVGALEEALERRMSEWEVAQGQLAGLQARREARQAGETGWADARLALVGAHVERLQAQLERAQQEAVGVRVELAGVRKEGAAHKEQAERLGRKLTVLQADLAAERSSREALSAGKEGMQGQQDGESAPDEATKVWFEEQVLRVLLRADPQEKLLGLTREACGLKLAHEQLLVALARARQKQDAATGQVAALRQVVEQLEASLEAAMHGTAQEAGSHAPGAGDRSSGEWSVAELTARLAVQRQEVYALRDEGLQLRQRVAGLEADLAEAEARQASSLTTAARQREHAEAAAVREAEEAAAAHQEEMRRVQQEREADARVFRQEMANLHREKARLLAEAQAEREAAVAHVRAQLAGVVQEKQALSGAQQEVHRIPQLEQQLELAQHQEHQLLTKVAALTAQLAALQDEREVGGGVVSDLERVVARLERASAGAVRGSSSKAAVAGGSLAAVSKQLVQAKLAEADAQRKLRVSARAELELRHLLAEREKRIDELKQGAVSPRDGPPGSWATELARAGGEGGQDEPEQRAARQAAVVDLRIDGARKDATIAGLQAALADATANSRRQDADLKDVYQQRDALEAQLAAAVQTERRLRQRVAWLEEDHVLTASAITSAIIADGAGTLNRPAPQGPLTETVQKLVQRLRDKDRALRKVAARKAGAAGETGAGSGGLGSSPPLVEAQKVVIAQLSARIAALLKEQQRVPGGARQGTPAPADAERSGPAVDELADPVPRSPWTERLATAQHEKLGLGRRSQTGQSRQPPPRRSSSTRGHHQAEEPALLEAQPQLVPAAEAGTSTQDTKGEKPPQSISVHGSADGAPVLEASTSALFLADGRQQAKETVKKSAPATEVLVRTAEAEEAPGAASALCELLLQHVEALEVSSLEVSAAAAGAAALEEAQAGTEREPEMTGDGRGAAGGQPQAVKEPAAVAPTTPGVAGAGRGLLASAGAGLHILPGKLEATAGAMATELSGMRAALAVLADGLGTLQQQQAVQAIPLHEGSAATQSGGVASTEAGVQTSPASQRDGTAQTESHGLSQSNAQTEGPAYVDSRRALMQAAAQEQARVAAGSEAAAQAQSRAPTESLAPARNHSEASSPADLPFRTPASDILVNRSLIEAKASTTDFQGGLHLLQSPDDLRLPPLSQAVDAREAAFPAAESPQQHEQARSLSTAGAVGPLPGGGGPGRGAGASGGQAPGAALLAGVPEAAAPTATRLALPTVCQQCQQSGTNREWAGQHATTCEASTMTEPQKDAVSEGSPPSDRLPTHSDKTDHVSSREAQTEAPPPAWTNGAAPAGAEQACQTLSPETQEQGVDACARTAEGSVGPGPGWEAWQREAAELQEQVEQARAGLRAVRAREAAVQHEAAEAARGARAREATVQADLETERQERQQEARAHVKQLEAVSAASRAAEAQLQVALARERVAVEEARHALQALSASNASAVARVEELEVRVRAKGGARATLAAGAAVMEAVQAEVAVLKAVVGSERQEHRQLTAALQTALGAAQAAQQEHAERDAQERAALTAELEQARREAQEGRQAVQEQQQAVARAAAELRSVQQRCAEEVEAGDRLRAGNAGLARQLAHTQQQLQEVEQRGTAQQAVHEERARLQEQVAQLVDAHAKQQESAPGPQHGGSSLQEEASWREERQRLQWARLVRAHRFSQLLQELRAKHRRSGLEAGQRVAALEAQLQATSQQGADVAAAAGREREQLVEAHIRNLQDVEDKMRAAQTRWQQEVAAVCADAEQRVAAAEAAGVAQWAGERERLELEWAVARKGLEVQVEAATLFAAQQQRERDACQDQLEQAYAWQRQGKAAIERLQAEHNRYRALKEHALQSLQACLQEAAPQPGPPAPRPSSPPTHDNSGCVEDADGLAGPWVQQVEAAAEAMRALAESEGLRAMAGELQRERHAQQALHAKLEERQRAAEQLRERLGAVSAELADMKRRAARDMAALHEKLRAAQAVADTHSAAAWQQQADALAACQHDLKAARADITRKRRLLSAAEAEVKQRESAAAAEVEARAALEAEVSKARAVSARQSAVIKELHRKLEAAAGVDRDSSGDRQRMAAAEEKVRTLSAALARKDAALKELREHARSGGKEAALAATAAAEREELEAAVKKWQGEASRREVALRGCRAQVEALRAERASVEAQAAEQAAGAQAQVEALRDEVADVRASEGELAAVAVAWARAGTRAVAALRMAGEAVAAAAEEAQSEGSEEWEDRRGEAALAAELVQLSMDEVRSVMGRKRGHVQAGPLAALVAELEKGQGGKGRGKKDKGRDVTRLLHNALAIFEQEVRWGEAMAGAA